MAGWWQRRRKIVSFPGAKLSPEVALARTLEKAQAGTIKSVYIGIEWNENSGGGFEGEWSNMPIKDLMAHAKVADMVATRRFFGENIDKDPIGDEPA